MVVIVRSPALRGTTKQSDNLLKSLEARLLRYALYTKRCPEPYRFRAVQGYARHDLSVGFSATCYYINCINKMDFGEEKKLPQ